MSLPKLFFTIYRCVVCGEEYEVTNCYLPYLMIPCEECNDRTKFLPLKIVHQSWEWDEYEN